VNYLAEINIMPLKELLDPQGKAVASSMKKLGFKEVAAVRIGKHITLKLQADSKKVAKQKVEDACKKLLANPVIEYYQFTLQEELSIKK